MNFFEALGFRNRLRELVFAVFSACSILWLLPLQDVLIDVDRSPH
jgi:hypothetical protein